MNRTQIDTILLLLSIKLAQPGQLGDIVEAYARLEPPDLEVAALKVDVKSQLERLTWQGYVWLYAGRRYMLTRRGERYVGASGLKMQIDSRRLYLLKETRKRSLAERGDTRDGPLRQRTL